MVLAFYKLLKESLPTGAFATSICRLTTLLLALLNEIRTCVSAKKPLPGRRHSSAPRRCPCVPARPHACARGSRDVLAVPSFVPVSATTPSRASALQELLNQSLPPHSPLWERSSGPSCGLPAATSAGQRRATPWPGVCQGRRAGRPQTRVPAGQWVGRREKWLYFSYTRAVERWRLGVRGSGSAVGVAGAVTGRLDRVRCTMTTSQRSATRIS